MDAAGHFFPALRNEVDDNWLYLLGFGWNVMPQDIENNDFLPIIIDGESLPVANAEYVNVRMVVPKPTMPTSLQHVEISTSFEFASRTTMVSGIAADVTGIQLTVVPEPSSWYLGLLTLLGISFFRVSGKHAERFGCRFDAVRLQA